MIAFFDMSSVNITRYNKDLLKNLKLNKKLFYALVDDPELCFDLGEYNYELNKTSYWTIKKFINFFKEKKVSILIVSGQRPADIRALIAANELSITIIYKMHGLYIPFMKRDLNFLYDKFLKILRTLYYLIDISFHSKSLKMLIGIFSSFVFGRSRKYWANTKLIQPTVCIIWSDYWIQWHKNHWQMNPQKGWHFSGNPDTVKFKTNYISGSIVYIYQTLVEDGRISKKIMNDFYNSLENFSKNQNINIHIKWHPRGDSIIREDLLKRGFIVTDDLPVSKIFIGHYSSLLGLAPLYDALVFIMEFEGHETPESVIGIANHISKNKSDFFNKLENRNNYLLNDIPKKGKAIFYFGDRYSEEVEMGLIKKYEKIYTNLGQ